VRENPTLVMTERRGLAFRKSRYQQHSRPRHAPGVQLLARFARNRHCYIALGHCSAGDGDNAGSNHAQPLFPRAFSMHFARCLAPAFLLAFVAARAQTQTSGPDRTAVLAVVQRLFDGMRAGDSAAVRSTFHPQALLATTANRDGKAVVRIDTVDAFVRAVGTPHSETWDERVRNPRVDMDGPLASVWADYSFYAGGKFSHCGVDAFQIARDGDAWRIVSLMDTRRQEGCPDQPSRSP
jgi:Putative lumazine-binding